MDNRTGNTDPNYNNTDSREHTVTDAWGEQVPDPGKLSYTTTTGVRLRLGVATRVGPVVVTTTFQAPGMAVAHVEGGHNALNRAKLTPLLGMVRVHERRRRNWHPERKWWSEWALIGGDSTDKDGNVLPQPPPRPCPYLADRQSSDAI